KRQRRLLDSVIDLGKEPADLFIKRIVEVDAVEALERERVRARVNERRPFGAESECRLPRDLHERTSPLHAHEFGFGRERAHDAELSDAGADIENSCRARSSEKLRSAGRNPDRRPMLI